MGDGSTTFLPALFFVVVVLFLGFGSNNNKENSVILNV